MATASVIFIYIRDKDNLTNSMSSKILTIRAMIEKKCSELDNYQSLNSNMYSKIVSETSTIMKTDITLFTNNGKAFKTTAPKIFDNTLFESRISEEAYYKIKFRNLRYCITEENYANNTFYILYAPIYNANEDLLAIVSAPYTNEEAIFNRIAFFHTATIISLFIILLVLVLLIGTKVVNSMFNPLIAMGKKMESANISGLESIKYENYQ